MKSSHYFTIINILVPLLKNIAKQHSENGESQVTKKETTIFCGHFEFISRENQKCLNKLGIQYVGLKKKLFMAF